MRTSPTAARAQKRARHMASAWAGEHRTATHLLRRQRAVRPGGRQGPPPAALLGRLRTASGDSRTAGPNPGCCRCRRSFRAGARSPWRRGPCVQLSGLTERRGAAMNLIVTAEQRAASTSSSWAGRGPSSVPAHRQRAAVWRGGCRGCPRECWPRVVPEWVSRFRSTPCPLPPDCSVLATRWRKRL